MEIKATESVLNKNQIDWASSFNHYDFYVAKPATGELEIALLRKELNKMRRY